MRITSASVFLLDLPFVDSFAHHLSRREKSNAIVVKLKSEKGSAGFGEGIARSYVTGEDPARCLDYIAEVLFPVVKKMDIAGVTEGEEGMKYLAHLSSLLPDKQSEGIVAWNAAISAVELALLDVVLRERGLSLASILRPRRQAVTYSGVIGAGSVDSAINLAKRYRALGVSQVKVKVDSASDWERVARVRQIMGPKASIRLDANASFEVDNCLEFLASVAQFQIEFVEQPLDRSDDDRLSQLRARSPIPIMVDESIVTPSDGARLIANTACDAFNLRITKCGGIFRTLALVEMARRGGVAWQLGCLVGESAILSAAGRHLAASALDPLFVEGSFGRHLLRKDVSSDGIEFGEGGLAPLLTKPGLGVEVDETVLAKFASTQVNLA